MQISSGKKVLLRLFRKGGKGPQPLSLLLEPDVFYAYADI